jgi:hypothetical protein
MPSRVLMGLAEKPTLFPNLTLSAIPTTLFQPLTDSRVSHVSKTYQGTLGAPRLYRATRDPHITRAPFSSATFPDRRAVSERDCPSTNSRRIRLPPPQVYVQGPLHEQNVSLVCVDVLDHSAVVTAVKFDFENGVFLCRSERFKTLQPQQSVSALEWIGRNAGRCADQQRHHHQHLRAAHPPVRTQVRKPSQAPAFFSLALYKCRLHCWLRNLAHMRLYGSSKSVTAANAFLAIKHFSPCAVACS